MPKTEGNGNGIIPLGKGLYIQSRAATLTQVNSRSLYYWSKKYLVEPHIHGRNGGPPIYSYNDLLAMRTVVRLRRAEMPLQRIRKAIKYLYKTLGRKAEWWNYKMVVDVRKDLIVVIPKDTSPSGQDEAVLASRHGQKPMEIILAELASDLLKGDRLEPFPEISEQVSISGSIQGGAPVIKGTRVPTSVIYEFHKRKLSVEQIAELYDDIDKVAIAAAIKYENALAQRNA